MDTSPSSEPSWFAALDRSLAAKILRAIILAIVLTSAVWLLAHYVLHSWLH